MINRNFKLLSTMLLTVAFPLLTHAEENFSYLLAEKEIEIISATKEAVSYQNVPRNVKVITREELDRWGVKNLFDLFRLLPEFYVRKSNFYLNVVGALGLKQSYFSEKIQVLIDGIPITDPSNGSSFSTDNNISLNNVKQVEIIYGPMTSLYGFNAAIAVINLVTYNPEDIDIKTGVSIATSGAKDSFFTKSFSVGKLKGLISFTYTESQEPLKEFTDWTGRTEKLRRSEKHANFFLKLNHESGFYTEIYAIDRDDFFPISLSNVIVNGDREYTRRKAIIDKFGLKKQISDSTKVEFSGFFNWFYLKRSYNLCPEFLSMCSQLTPEGLYGVEERFLRNPGGSFYFSRNTSIGLFSGGFEISKVDLYKTTLSADFLPSTLQFADPSQIVTFPFQDITPTEVLMSEKERTTTSYYIQYFWQGEKTSILLNARSDRASDVGKGISYSFSLLYKPKDNLKFKLNTGKAIRVPSFEEMYIENNPILLGNPDLKLEKVYSFMPSVEVVLKDKIKLTGGIYINWIKDMIYKKRLYPDSTKFVWDNAKDTIKIKGMIIDISTSITPTVTIYTSTHRIFFHSSTDDKNLFSYPDWKVVSGISIKPYKKFTIDLNCEAYSKVSDAVGGYAIFNLTSLYSLNAHWKLSAQVYNIFDRDVYYPVYSQKLPGEGRNLWVGLSYSF